MYAFCDVFVAWPDEHLLLLLLLHDVWEVEMKLHHCALQVVSDERG